MVNRLKTALNEGLSKLQRVNNKKEASTFYFNFRDQYPRGGQCPPLTGPGEGIAQFAPPPLAAQSWKLEKKVPVYILRFYSGR